MAATTETPPIGPRVDPGERALRDAFGRFATGVALATCLDRLDNPVAVTVNSFVSISLRPPIVSFALGEGAHCLAAFEAAPRFAVQILALSQISLARMFARPSSCRWEVVAHRRTQAGHLLVDGCAASFLCASTSRAALGDHVILYGTVVGLETFEHRAPLAFYRGRFGCVHPSPGDVEPGSDTTIGWS